MRKLLLALCVLTAALTVILSQVSVSYAEYDVSVIEDEELDEATFVIQDSELIKIPIKIRCRLNKMVLMRLNKILSRKLPEQAVCAIIDNLREVENECSPIDDVAWNIFRSDPKMCRDIIIIK